MIIKWIYRPKENSHNLSCTRVQKNTSFLNIGGHSNEEIKGGTNRKNDPRGDNVSLFIPIFGAGLKNPFQNTINNTKPISDLIFDNQNKKDQNTTRLQNDILGIDCSIGISQVDEYDSRNILLPPQKYNLLSNNLFENNILLSENDEEIKATNFRLLKHNDDQNNSLKVCNPHEFLESTKDNSLKIEKVKGKPDTHSNVTHHITQMNVYNNHLGIKMGNRYCREEQKDDKKFIIDSN